MTTHESYAAVAETHSGVVFFVGDHAYKIKKPVAFGFLDFRSRETRHAICHREVELNRRLSPDVYLGVADILGPDGNPLDHAVVMRRLPDERRLVARLHEGGVEHDIEQIARTLAAFHANAARSSAIDACASAGTMTRRWDANALEIERFLGSVLDRAAHERALMMATRYLAGRAALFADRIARGRACDGHGDLLAEDIFCLDDGPRILDCIEFDDTLRWGDVLADMAFLAMDLEDHGAGDLAVRLLDQYRQAAADAWPDSLCHHYIAERAHIRAKVACLRWEQGNPAGAHDARRLLSLATSHLEAGRVHLVVVGGLPGTGKSTLASSLGERLGAAVLRTDELRGDIVPSTGAAPYEHGRYRPDSTNAVYQSLLERARLCLMQGESVVLDATWRDPHWRDVARALADEVSADLHELLCQAPWPVMEARIAARGAAGVDPSEATIEVARAMADSCPPWPSATTINTTTDPTTAAAEAIEVVLGPEAA